MVHVTGLPSRGRLGKLEDGVPLRALLRAMSLTATDYRGRARWLEGEHAGEPLPPVLGPGGATRVCPPLTTIALGLEVLRLAFATSWAAYRERLDGSLEGLAGD